MSAAQDVCEKLQTLLTYMYMYIVGENEIQPVLRGAVV